MPTKKQADDGLITTTVRLPASEIAELDREAERLARESGTIMKRSDAIRIAVRRFLDGERTAAGR